MITAQLLEFGTLARYDESSTNKGIRNLAKVYP